MRSAALVVLAACSSPTGPVSSPSSAPPPTAPAPAAPAAHPAAAPPPAAPLPPLTASGLGALTGDTLFSVDAIRQALPALTLDRLGGPVQPPGLAARRITAITWSADP